MKRSRPWVPGVVAVALATGVAPAFGHAQTSRRFAAHAELGGGGMIAAYQRESLGDVWLVEGALHLGVSVFDSVAVQVGGAYSYFPSAQGGAANSVWTAGLRFEPRVAGVGRAFVDAGGGVGITGRKFRPEFEAAVGFEFALGEFLSVGPYVRYRQVFASAQDWPSDAMYLVGGVSIALRDQRAAAPGGDDHTPGGGDSDGDRVPDADDRCPRIAAGPRPDPERRGCPGDDADRDGVPDRDDVCAHEAAGSQPDPDRPGCPVRDGDRDGIADASDRCPEAPAGAHPDPDRAGCPDADDDGDRVPNHADLCPSVHQGFHPNPERSGCPLPDRDNDSIPDAADACPDRPGAPRQDARRNGCPGLIRVDTGQVHIMRPVYFGPRRDVILPRSRPVLAALADALRATPEIRRVSIQGHTDDTGDDQFNLGLSQRRAMNVMAWLVRYGGIDSGRLEAHGYGESQPIVPARSEAARAVNRRVEFHVLELSTDEPQTTSR